jgi:hypothetical protein
MHAYLWLPTLIVILFFVVLSILDAEPMED